MIYTQKKDISLRDSKSVFFSFNKWSCCVLWSVNPCVCVCVCVCVCACVKFVSELFVYDFIIK